MNLYEISMSVPFEETAELQPDLYPVTAAALRALFEASKTASLVIPTEEDR